MLGSTPLSYEILDHESLIPWMRTQAQGRQIPQCHASCRPGFSLNPCSHTCLPIGSTQQPINECGETQASHDGQPLRAPPSSSTPFPESRPGPHSPPLPRPVSSLFLVLLQPSPGLCICWALCLARSPHSLFVAGMSLVVPLAQMPPLQSRFTFFTSLVFYLLVYCASFTRTFTLWGP